MASHRESVLAWKTTSLTAGSVGGQALLPFVLGDSTHSQSQVGQPLLPTPSLRWFHTLVLQVDSLLTARIPSWEPLATQIALYLHTEWATLGCKPLWVLTNM